MEVNGVPLKVLCYFIYLFVDNGHGEQLSIACTQKPKQYF